LLNEGGGCICVSFLYFRVLCCAAHRQFLFHICCSYIVYVCAHTYIVVIDFVFISVWLVAKVATMRLLMLLAQDLCLKLRPCSLTPPVGCVARVCGTSAVGAAIGATTGAAAIVSTASRVAT